MKNLRNYFASALISAAVLSSCNPLQLDEVQDPNNPSVGSVSNNATPQQIQFLVTGLESRHRGYVTNIS